MDEAKFSQNLDDSCRLLEKRCHRSHNQDVKRRDIIAGGIRATLYYVEGMVAGEKLEWQVLSPLLSMEKMPDTGRAAYVIQNVISIAEAESASDLQTALGVLFYGGAVLLLDGESNAVCVDAKGFVRRSVGKPTAEQVVFGPHEAFNESIRDNITLVRRAMRSPDLICDLLDLGQRMTTQLAVIYWQPAADARNVETLRRRLSGLNLDTVQSIGALMQLLEDEPMALLPQFVLTERPDRVASFLVEGQICLLLDGSAQALCMPASLFTFFNAPDDTYLRWPYGTFNRLVRIAGVAVSMLLPAITVVALRFEMGILPPPILTAVLETQSRAPLPAGVEMMIMLLFFYLINEAGMRVPGVISGSMGLVSSLVLGSAAVDAQLISPVLIIAVAVSGLGLYATPNFGLSMGLRLWQFWLLLLSSLLGMPGLLLGVCSFICATCALCSLGAPLLAPVWPKRPHNPDIAVRLPIWRQRLRGFAGNPDEMRRTRGRMRGWEDEP